MQILKNVGTTLSYPWPMSSAQILSVITSIATQNPGYRKIYGLQTVTSGGASTQRVAWVKANFLSGIPFRMSATKLEREYFKFLDFIAEFEATTFQYSATNANGSVTLHSAPPTASATVRVTSECWVRMATELQAIRGTVSSIAVSLAFAVFATLIFTGDVFVALMALLSMLAIILAVIAILVALKVKFGIVEAISLTILVGISVDFSLHLAESFTRSHFTSRGLRGVDAVSRVGYPIFSAAMTTMSAVIPMLWCQVQVLVRFGQIIPLCIVMSLVYGVHFFLPMLMSFGPNVPGGGAGKMVVPHGKASRLALQHANSPHDFPRRLRHDLRLFAPRHARAPVRGRRLRLRRRRRRLRLPLRRRRLRRATMSSPRRRRRRPLRAVPRRSRRSTRRRSTRRPRPASASRRRATFAFAFARVKTFQTFFPAKKRVDVMANASRVIASLSRAFHRASRAATGARDTPRTLASTTPVSFARLDRASNRSRDRFESIV